MAIDKDNHIVAAPDESPIVGQGGVLSLTEAWERAICSVRRGNDTQLELLPGVYRIDAPLVYDGAGAEAGCLRVTGAGATVSAAYPIPAGGFLPVEGEEYYCYQFPEDDEGRYPVFRNLLINGRKGTVAHRGARRFAEGGQYLTVAPLDFVEDESGQRVFQSSRYYLRRDSLYGITEKDLAHLELHIELEWEFKAVHIDRIDLHDVHPDHPDYVAVYIDENDFADMRKNSNQSLTHIGRYYWLENALSFLSEETYFYDRAEGRLYFMPASGKSVDDYTFACPRTNRFLSFYDTHRVTLEGLTFVGCDCLLGNDEGISVSQAGRRNGEYISECAIYAENADMFRMEGCTLRELGADGLSMRGVLQHVSVIGNRFLHIGASALRFGNANGAWDEESNSNENLLIEGNLIDGAAEYLRGCPGICITVARYCRVLHNTIRNTSYSGISIGWLWSPASFAFGERWHLYHVEIAYNRISEFCTDMRDGGAIYTLGGNVIETYRELFNSLHDNYITVSERVGGGILQKTAAGREVYRYMVVYHDGASSNWHTHHNVIRYDTEVDCLGIFYLQTIFHRKKDGTYSNQLTHNILCEGNTVIDARADKNRDRMRDVVYWNRFAVERNVHEKDTEWITPDEELSARARETCRTAGALLL